MRLVSVKLASVSGWATPWQADTVLGMMAVVYGRAHGSGRLAENLLNPWRQGDPPFVISDGFPGDLLPAPRCLPFWPWPDTERKRVKRIEWLTRSQFLALQRGERPDLSESLEPPFRRSVRVRNTLDRTSDATGGRGTLYEVPEETLAQAHDYLRLYARVGAGKEGFLEETLSLLAERGFGADASVGFGQFQLAGGLEDAGWLSSVGDSNAWVSLSSFQPGAQDPTEGYWRSFVKYGKLGPEMGVPSVFKRPQWMLRSGSCFYQGGAPRDWYGRVIDSDALLPSSVVNELASGGVRPVQPAFALAVPMRWAREYRI